MSDHPDQGNIATLPDAEYISNARNYWQEKELINRLQVVAKVGDKYETPIDACFWMGRSRSASVVYCSVWIRGRNKEALLDLPDPELQGLRHRVIRLRKGYKDLAGRGTAGGGGYHKESAALNDAIRSAGVVMGSDFGGYGEGAMRHALTAIAAALGYQDFTIV